MDDSFNNGHAGQPLDKFREPDKDIKEYAQLHGITLDLWSNVVQNVIRYRIAIERQREAAGLPPAPPLSQERRSELEWEAHWPRPLSSSDENQ